MGKEFNPKDKLYTLGGKYSQEYKRITTVQTLGAGYRTGLVLEQFMRS